MLFADLVHASRAVSSTTSRLAKAEHIAGALVKADPEEIDIVVSYLSGELRQRRTGVGYAALRDLPPAAAAATLEVSEVDARFQRLSEIAGKGSTAARRELLAELWGAATTDEQTFLAGLIGGEIRQGALDGVMLDAVIKASGLPAADVRRAVMLAGGVGEVTRAALAEGADGLARFRLEVGRPLRPMLASPAPDMTAALEKIGGPAAVEWKLDGIRVQIHRHPETGEITIYTRTLDDVTTRLPEIVETAEALPATSFVLDGEVIALDETGRPRAFQVTASRTGSRTDIEKLRQAVPLSVFCFDILHLDGRDLIGEPAQQRWEALAGLVPEDLRTPRLVTDDLEAATGFAEDAVARGHEGAVVKSLDSVYDAGRRGASWIKVKPRHTLDLVILAAEWGHGRRTGFLSNLHLGARNPETGQHVMLGKTFKGLTDEMLRWQTERLLELEERRDNWTVYVRPELVVEIAFDGVQRSTRYPGGMALRFARVIRYREDKSAQEADNVEAVKALYNPT